MVLDDYSNMSIDELGSSLLQKKEDDERRAAKKSRKNERIQQALGVLLMGQGIMKNQYKKRVKELDDMHKFQIMDNESQAKELAMHSQLTGKIGNKWEDKGGDLESRFNSFESSADYSGFAQEARPYIDQKIKALSPQDYADLYGTATYENAVRLATKQFAENYLKTDKDGVSYYKKQEQLLRNILDDSEGKDMDRLTLFTRGAGLTTASLTAYDRKNYQKVLNEYRSQNNLVGGFKRVIGLFNDKQIKQGGPDLFSAMTENDLAGPLITDITQALNLKGMTNSLGASLDEAKKSPTVWREMAQRSTQYKSMRERTANFTTGPLSGMLEDIEDGVYPSELGGTMTNISASNIKEFFQAMDTPERSGQKDNFIFDTTALAIRLSKDKQFREDVWRNTEGKKKNGKSLDEFEFILQDENNRIKFSAMMAIDVGFERDTWTKIDGAKYNTYGTLIGIYDTMKLSRVIGEGVSVQNNGKVKISDTYTKMKPEQKKQAIDDEVKSIILDPKNNSNSISIKLNGLSKEIQKVFGENLEEFKQNFQKRNTPPTSKEEALEEAGATRTPLPFEEYNQKKNEEILITENKDTVAFTEKLGNALTDTSQTISKGSKKLINELTSFFEIPKIKRNNSLLEKEDFLLATGPNPEILKKLVPENILAFAKYKLGNMFKSGKGQDIDVANFGTEQKEVLKTAMKNAVEDGRNYIKYSDYPNMANGKKVIEFYKGARADRNIIDLLKESFTDPVFEMFTTTGVFKFEQLNNGKFKIIDDLYDFDKSKSRKEDRENPRDTYAKLVYSSQDISENQKYNFYVKGTI